MIGKNLKDAYRTLTSMGLVRSKRQFSRDYLGRHWSYLRDFEARDRDGIRIPEKTVLALRARLRAVARLVPPKARTEIQQVVEEIDRDTRIADLLGYSSRGR